MALGYPTYPAYPGNNTSYGYYQPQTPGLNYQPTTMTVPPVAAQQPAQAAQVQAPVQPVQTQTASNGIIWVQGEEGAKAWRVDPGTTVMLMDSDCNSFYLKSADNSGMPMPLRIFDYTERVSAPKTPLQAQSTQQADYVTRDEFNALADKLERQMEALTPQTAPKSSRKPASKEDAE